MQAAITLAKNIAKDTSKNYYEEFFLINLHKDFDPIYKSGYTQTQSNVIAAFIIFSYDNDSPWLDLQKDRHDNKRKILISLGVDPDSKIYSDILNYDDDGVQEVILSYLLNQTDARWQEIISLLDYSTKMLLFCNRKTSDKNKKGTRKNDLGEMEDEFDFLDQTEVAKINKEKGDLLLKAIEARKRGEELLQQIRNDYVKVDNAVQKDFGFQFTDNKKFDHLIWEQRVRKRKLAQN